MLVVHCKQLQLLHVHFLQKRVQVDTLDQALNVAVQLLILFGKVGVLGTEGLVAAGQLRQLSLLLILLTLQLRIFDLKTQQLLTVVGTFVLDDGSLLREQLHFLFGVNLSIQHVASKVFLLLQLLKHHLGLFVLVLETSLKSGDLFALRLKLKTLLVCFGYSTALKTVLHLEVLLVNLSFLSQNVQNLFVRVLLLALEVFDP